MNTDPDKIAEETYDELGISEGSSQNRRKSGIAIIKSAIEKANKPFIDAICTAITDLQQSRDHPELVNEAACALRRSIEPPEQEPPAAATERSERLGFNKEAGIEPSAAATVREWTPQHVAVLLNGGGGISDVADAHNAAIAAEREAQRQLDRDELAKLENAKAGQ